MRKAIFFGLGWVCLLLGLIGVLLPLLPTTPFIILAAYCFSRSSRRFHQMLVGHRLFGPIIRDWEAHGVIPLKVKWISSTMMLLMISYPVFFKPLHWAIDASMLGVAAIALLYIWSRPSQPKDQASSPDKRELHTQVDPTD
ncbi:YbaN family protein [Motiliproteus sp.]|uniref:YbaN family protein n=1 Tax=Motiliproteus sp. TaxID=1898955 RepID=UPI003BAC0A6F